MIGQGGVAAMAAAALLCACAGSGPAANREGTMAMSNLIGSWRKQPGEDCAAPYPADLAILPGGQYRGSSLPAGNYTVWDVGTWTEHGPDTVALSTANDAVIRYRYRLSEGELQLEDPEGCTIRYVRLDE